MHECSAIIKKKTLREFMLANLQIDTEVLHLIIIFRKQLVRVTPNEDAENLQNTHPQGHS